MTQTAHEIDAAAPVLANSVPDAADTRVIARYADPGGWLDKKPAIVTRSVGKGSITYVGAWLDAAAMRVLAGRMLDEAAVATILPVASPDIEVSARAGAERCVLVVINHGVAAQPVSLPSGARLVVGAVPGGTLPAHGVAVAEVPRDAVCR